MKKRYFIYIIISILSLGMPGCSVKQFESRIENVSQDIIDITDDSDDNNTADNDIIVENEIIGSSQASEIDIDLTDINDEDEEADPEEEDSDDEEEQEEEPYEPVEAASGDERDYNSAKRVLCYGDSLTEGTGGGGVTMPNVLEELSGATVLNYGVYADTASCVAARMGANPQYLVDTVIVPADPTPVEIKFKGKYGYEMLLVFGDAGVNNVFLDGIEGRLFMDSEGTKLFSRITPGEEKMIQSGAQLITHAIVDRRPGDIIVLWAGCNDRPQNKAEIQPVIDKLNEMIKYLATSQYIVLTDTSNHSRTPVVEEVNEALREEYGQHCLDIRDYLVNHAMDDLGLEKTENDIASIKRGDVPGSIKTDDIHGNSDYYRLVGEQVYKKLVGLNYLK